LTVLCIGWCPVPRLQLVQPVDLVIVDAVEDVSKIWTCPVFVPLQVLV
jgi:hypothetical protein